MAAAFALDIVSNVLPATLRGIRRRISLWELRRLLASSRSSVETQDYVGEFFAF
jgi:hypothetical protein